MLKSFFALLLFFMAFSPLRGQSGFMHSMGGTYVFAFTDSTLIRAFEITYAPRVQAALGEHASLSIGVKPAIAPTSWALALILKSGVRALELPLLLQFNSGLGANKSTGPRRGFYLGGGFGMAYMTRTRDARVSGGWMYGPAAEAGMHFHFTGLPLALRLKSMYDIANARSWNVGLGILVTLGMGQ